MSSTSTTAFRPRWRGKASKEQYVLFDPTSDQVSLLEPGEREHDGDAHASALGPEPALPDVPSLGQPALPRVQLSRPSGEPDPPLRHSRPARPASDRGRVAGRSAARATDS